MGANLGIEERPRVHIEAPIVRTYPVTYEQDWPEKIAKAKAARRDGRAARKGKAKIFGGRGVMTTAADHQHCFCSANTTTGFVCCRCGQTYKPVPRINLYSRFTTIVNWVDQTLFFVNSQGKHDK